jgi:hypothetical protein
VSRQPKNQLALKFNHTKRALLKSKWALSTVVTTLIILVISVLLASVVTYFAINVVSTRVQEESLALTKQHVWYSKDGTQAALMIINTGGRDVVIQKFAIRGQTVGWKNVFYATTDKAVSADLGCDTAIAEGSKSIGGVSLPFINAKDSLTLRSGYSMVLYINTPDSITINDVGLTVSITLNTAQAMYYVESNVQAVGDSSSPVQEGNEEPDDNPGYTITNVHAWYDGLGNQIAFVVTNNRGIDFQLDFSSFKANGVQIGAAYMAKGEFTVDIDLPYAADIKNPIDGHPLDKYELSTAIPDGQTAIIYATGCSGITADDLGKQIDIWISTSALPATRTVRVEASNNNQ